MTDAIQATPSYKLHRTDAPDTSVEAAQHVDTPRMALMVLRVVAAHGDSGCVQDDVIRRLVLCPYSSVTARFKALLDDKLIALTGERRKGRSGRSQRVIRITDAGYRAVMQ